MPNGIELRKKGGRPLERGQPARSWAGKALSGQAARAPMLNSMPLPYMPNNNF